MVKLRTANEFILYALFTVAVAIATAFIARARLPASQQPLVVRNSADALRLRTALKLGAGTTAVVEFMDFECPPCRASYPRLKSMLRGHPLVPYLAVDFPLSIHPYAFGAAVVARIAESRGQHDQVLDDLFTGRTDRESTAAAGLGGGEGLFGVPCGPPGVGEVVEFPSRGRLNADRTTGGHIAKER